MMKLRGRTHPDMIQIPLLVMEGNGVSHIRGHFFFNGSPTAMIPSLSELMLNGNQQMIGQHANEKMPGGPVLMLMIHRSESQLRLQILESGFHLIESHIQLPDGLSRQMRTGGMDHITACELLTLLTLHFFLVPIEGEDIFFFVIQPHINV